MKLSKIMASLLNINNDAPPKKPIVIQDIPEHRMTPSEFTLRRTKEAAKARVESRQEVKPVPRVEPLSQSRKEQLKEGWIKAKPTRGPQQWKYFTAREWESKTVNERMKYVIDATPVPGNLKAKVVRGGRRTRVFSSLN